MWIMMESNLLFVVVVAAVAVILLLAVPGGTLLVVSVDDDGDDIGPVVEADYDDGVTPKLETGSGAVTNLSPVQSAANKTLYDHLENELWPSMLALNRAFHKLRWTIEQFFQAIERDTSTEEDAKVWLHSWLHMLNSTLHMGTLPRKPWIREQHLSEDFGEALQQMMNGTVPSAVERLLAIPKHSVPAYMEKKLTSIEAHAKEYAAKADLFNAIQNILNAQLIKLYAEKNWDDNFPAQGKQHPDLLMLVGSRGTKVHGDVVGEGGDRGDEDGRNEEASRQSTL